LHSGAKSPLSFRAVTYVCRSFSPSYEDVVLTFTLYPINWQTSS